jgi:Ca2+-transporting ATPase
LCTRKATVHGDVRLSEKDRSLVLDRAREMAGNALRVLAIAYRRLPADARVEEGEHDLVFAALVGIQDPPRPEVSAITCGMQASGR